MKAIKTVVRGCVVEEKQINTLSETQTESSRREDELSRSWGNCWHSCVSEVFCLCACACVSISPVRHCCRQWQNHKCSSCRLKKTKQHSACLSLSDTDLCSCGSWSSRPSGWRGRGPGWGAQPPGSAHSRVFRDAPDRTSSSADTRCSLSTATMEGKRSGLDKR